MGTKNFRERIALPPEAEPARAFIEALGDRYEARIEGYERRIRELEERVERLTPRNSSLPPSSEHPHARPRRKPPKGKKKRKRGGQQGHSANFRQLIPTEQCAAVVPCAPAACRRCGIKSGSCR